MGALAPVTSWNPEDDLLLKNAVEAGASLESLAKGAVHFSRRFTVRELQERWHALLYNPYVSAEASTHMIDYERSASSLPSKFTRFVSTKENRCLSVKRKSQSVRNCYYSLHKRICNDPYNNNHHYSLDFSYLVRPGDSNYTGINDYPQDPMPNDLGLNGLDMDIMHHSLPQNGPLDEDHLHGEFPNILDEDEGVADFGPVEGLQVDPSLFDASSEFGQIHNDQANISCELEGHHQGLSSPISDCGAASFHNVEFPSPLSGIPIWRTSSAPALPVDIGLTENDVNTRAAFELPDNEDNAQNTGTSGYDIHPDSNMDIEVPCDDLKSSFAELTDSLLDFTNEDELLYMDVDGKDVIDKSYYDGLSSLLLNSPNDHVNQDEVAALAPDMSHMDPIGPSSQDEVENIAQYIEEQMIVDLEVQELVKNASAFNKQCSEIVSRTINCTLNSEDPEVPCNDDVFLMVQFSVPTVSLTKQQHFQEFNKPIPLPFKSFSGNEKCGEIPSSHNLMEMEMERKSSGEFLSHMLPERGHDRSDGTSYGPSNMTSANLSATSIIPTRVKEESKEIPVENPLCSKRPLYNTDGIKEKVHMSATVQDHQLLRTEVGSIERHVSQEVLNPASSDQEQQHIESDGDIPYFSDIEAMILDMDLDPDEQDLYSCEEVLRYRNDNMKKTLIRLEQSAHSYMQRSIASHGAFAVLYGRHSKHYIKKAEVLLGRATEDIIVDIDLGREGHTNKISRRQAIIKLDQSGSFSIKNLGKCLILVNNKEVASGHSLNLSSSYLVEIREMSFIFEINPMRVRQYLDSIARENQTHS